MPRLIDVIADEVVGHSVNLMRYDATIRKQVLSIMENLQEDLVSKITQADPTAAKTTSLKLQRARQLLADTTATIDNYYEKAGAVAQKGLLNVAQIESNFSRKSINTLIGADLMSVSLDPTKLKKLADEALVLGAPAADWWGRQREDLKKKYADQIRMGVASGENLSQITQRIRGKYTGRYIEVENAKGVKRKVPEFAGGVLPASTRNAEALIITSVHSVSNAARLESYQKNTDVIKGVSALVTLDNRTTPMCRGRSGMSWDIRTGEPLDTKTNIKFPGPPAWHYRCRTTLVPVLKSWAELAGPKSTIGKAKLDELEAALPRKMQSSMDGQVAGDLNYEDWIKTKPEAFQKEVLGPGRWKLWTENKIGFADMIDQTGNPLTLLELEAKINQLPNVAHVWRTSAEAIAIQNQLYSESRSVLSGDATAESALKQYQRDSNEINNLLRTDGTSKTIQPKIDALDRAAAVDTEAFVYRGANRIGSLSLPSNLQDALKLVGQSGVERGFVSTSIAPSNFLSNDAQMIVIRGQKKGVLVFAGRPTKMVEGAIAKGELLSEGAEVLLARNSEYRIVGVSEAMHPTLKHKVLVYEVEVVPSAELPKAPKVFKKGSEAVYQSMEELGFKDARTYYEDTGDSFKRWKVGQMEELLGRPVSEYLEIFKGVSTDVDRVVFRSFEGESNYGAIGIFRREPFTEITRSFKRENGKFIVTHDHMELDDTLHGQGISKRFSKASFEFYKKAKVDRVEVYASMGNGGYTWARYGFLPYDVKEWHKVYDRLRRIDNQEFQEFLKTVDTNDVKSIWSVADSKWGKEVLSGQSWEGAIDMNDKVQMKRLNQYLGMK